MKRTRLQTLIYRSFQNQKKYGSSFSSFWFQPDKKFLEKNMGWFQGGWRRVRIWGQSWENWLNWMNYTLTHIFISKEKKSKEIFISFHIFGKKYPRVCDTLRIIFTQLYLILSVQQPLFGFIGSRQIVIFLQILVNQLFTAN